MDTAGEATRDFSERSLPAEDVGVVLRRAVGGRCGRGTSDPDRLGGPRGGDGRARRVSKIDETRGAVVVGAARERTARACFAASRMDAGASPPDAVVGSRTPSEVPAAVMSGCLPSRREREVFLFQLVARRRGLDRARAYGDGAATFDDSRAFDQTPRRGSPETVRVARSERRGARRQFRRGRGAPGGRSPQPRRRANILTSARRAPIDGGCSRPSVSARALDRGAHLSARASPCRTRTRARSSSSATFGVAWTTCTREWRAPNKTPAGPFDALFCVGPFFEGAADDAADGDGADGDAARHAELRPYVDGTAVAPIPTYFVEGLPAGRAHCRDPDGVVAPNITFPCATPRCASSVGLRVAVLPGRHNDMSYADAAQSRRRRRRRRGRTPRRGRRRPARQPRWSTDGAGEPS